MIDQDLQFDGFKKRSGHVVPFSRQKIEQAISKSAKAVSRSGGDPGIDTRRAADLTQKVLEQLNTPASEYYVRPEGDGRRIPHIEDVQDLVEIVLAEADCALVVAASSDTGSSGKWQEGRSGSEVPT